MSVGRQCLHTHTHEGNSEAYKDPLLPESSPLFDQPSAEESPFFENLFHLKDQQFKPFV